MNTTPDPLGPSPLGTEPSSRGLGEAAQDAKDELKGLASQAKEQTLHVADQAKSQVSRLVDQQRNEMADRLRTLAGSLREAGQKLQEKDTQGYGRYADRAAGQVERASDYLRRQDLNAAVRDLEGLARRHPDLFLGGALIAGVLLARFLKASADKGPWQGYPQSAYANPPYERYGEGSGAGSRYGAGTGTYGEPYANTAGGL